MTKDEIKEEQPVAWKIFSNVLKEEGPYRLSHAYLFSGPREASKKEMALLVAKSLLCLHRDEDGFACGECENCRAIENQSYLDLHWLKPGSMRQQTYTRKQIHDFFDGKEPKEQKVSSSITKDEILALQDAFSLSARQGNWQIFVIEDYDKATPEASNAFLKFLEEPKPGVIGILISERPERILDTIVSRCQQIHFRSPSVSRRKEILMMEGIVEDQAEFFTHFGYSLEEARQILERERTQSIFSMAEEYAHALDDFQMIFDLETKLFHKQSIKQPVAREEVRLFMQKLLFEIKRSGYSYPVRARLQEIVLDHLDSLERPFDLLLYLEDLYYQLLMTVQNE